MTSTAPASIPPPEQAFWTEVDGHRIHARHWVEHGRSAPNPVVLVHGFGVGSRMCQPAARRLATRRQVHAPDLPGFADSDKPPAVLSLAELADALAAWTRAIHLPPATLVGVSLGAQVVAETARRHRDVASHVVLASPIVEPERRRWRTQIARWQLERLTQSLRLQAIQLADYPKAGPRRLIRTFSEALDYRLEDTVEEVAQPTLVCWGTRDPLVSRAWTEHLTERLPDGRLAVLPGAVHAMSHDSPLELARAISYFVDGATAAPTTTQRTPVIEELAS